MLARTCDRTPHRRPQIADRPVGPSRGSAAISKRWIRWLDPAERYYWFLEQLGPMNAVTVAELDSQPDPDELGEALRAVQAAHPLLRVGVEVVDGNPAFVEGPAGIPLTVSHVRREQLPAAFETEMDLQFDLRKAPLARTLYLPLDDDPGSVVITTTHHVVSDGLAVIGLMRELLRMLGGGPPGQTENDPPFALHDRFPAALASPKAAVAVLRAIRDERAGMSPAQFPFHDRRATGRRPRFHQLALTEPGIGELAARAKAHGATVNGMIAAAALQAASSLFGEDADRTIVLSTPADLRSLAEPPIDGGFFGVAVGLLSSPYVVRSGAESGLARQISEQTRREVQRGEAHLFYRLARASAHSADAKGVAAFRDWFEHSTPDSIAVSNMGRIDDAGDPSFVRSVTAVMSPSSNQVAFLSVSTYRGKLLINVMTDAAKLPPEYADALVDGVATRLGATRRWAR
jgi:hypothetical protein